jgi:hypothetical protein
VAISIFSSTNQTSQLRLSNTSLRLPISSMAHTALAPMIGIGGENRIAKDVDLTALLRYHTPPCNCNHASCDARKEWT